jgi:hypothetical protein
MARAAFVAGIEFAAPQVKQRQCLRRRAHLVAQIVGDAAVGVDGVKVRTQRLGQKPRGYMEVFVVRLGQCGTRRAPLRAWAQPRECDSGGQRGPAARKQLVQIAEWPLARLPSPERSCSGCMVVIVIASGHNGGLDLAAAVHQLLKDAVEFVEVSVAGDEAPAWKRPLAIRSSALRQMAGVWWKVARRVMSLVVNAIGVERDVRAHGAAAEEVDRAALAHQFDRLLPGLGHADGLNGDIDAAILWE